ncbi:ABC transporter permease [Floccifex sp.]|uniref:ABC transporter permease n=1 Tax=Floccifex sp. TaxID=2815810 RepID=UPI003F08DC65
MKLSFNLNFAMNAIKKNKKTYGPYILTSSGMVMMFYIIRYLIQMPSMETIPGGESIAMMLNFGSFVLALFALIFLFYTHSFLMKQRQKEYGLYNMLGMGKKHLSILLAWETIIIFVISICLGLFSGFLLSKMNELLLIQFMDGTINYNLTMNLSAVIYTFIVFIPIFVLIFIKSWFSILKMNTITLMKSEQIGEKPPKANYVFGIVGLILLAIAYYIALSIESPLIALAWFFIAVSLVIIATYLLFISGSVVLCKILQKNKNYYYQKNHFVSVSSMSYRMKRNGAGLASICVLSTMVIVMMMGAGSLYFGKEYSLNERYPYDFSLSFYDENEVFYKQEVDALLKEQNVNPINLKKYSIASTTGLFENGKLILDPTQVNEANAQTMDNVANIYLISLDSYNVSMNKNEVLEDNEILMHCVRTSYNDDSISLKDGTKWVIKKQVDDMLTSGEAVMNIIPSIFMVVKDINPVINCFNSQLDEQYPCFIKYKYEFDTHLSKEKQFQLNEILYNHLRNLSIEYNSPFSLEFKEQERSEFYSIFGGIFFLAIFLMIIFVAATVLIIYYKQISEGYEDRNRFEIMRKVGMKDEDIRKSINSQMLTIFFLPLIMAALHVTFAFPIVQKLLAMFNLRNVTLSLIVTGICIFIFGLFYVIVYKITSNVYYDIVSGHKQ